ADVIDVAVAIHVIKVRTVCALDEERLAPHRLERAHRRVDAAGDQLERAGEQGVGLVVLHGVLPGSGEGSGAGAGFARVAQHAGRCWPRGDRAQRGAGGYWLAAAASPGALNASRSALAAAAGSGASNTPPMTASRSAPAATSAGALSAVMPPIATSGLPSARASCSSVGVARRVVFLLELGKNAPNAR